MEFTYVCSCSLNGGYESWTGTICPLMPFDCTEYIVSARGSSFHLVIGKHEYSRYIYIPTWNIAMDISYLDDRFWNREHLLRNYPELSPVDAVSIVEALAAIKKHKA
ncbi:MAG: hypothetical protein PUI37_04805 [Oscillospiraceae bacterium]|nr:hypothetical protein [Oscillospiraceae bacterium]